MKRFILSLFVLITGAALGAGGLYVGTHWDKFDPLRKDGRQDPLPQFVTQLRKACATDAALKGTIIKSVELANGKLALRGLVARKEQIATLEAKGQELLAESPELQTQGAGGFATDGLLVLAIHEQLSILQRDFGEHRGAENDPKLRDVMRTTRLDAVNFGEDGKLTFSGVCIRGNAKTEASSEILKDALKNRLAALGVTPALMPEIVLDVRFFANPARTLQKQLAQNERGKDIRLVSAWYDGTGKLHVAGIVARDAEGKVVEEALDAIAKDPQTAAIVKSPPATPSFTHHLTTFASETRVPELQKKLIDYARTENKPHLRRVRIEQITPTPLDNEKQITADDEAALMYAFRVKGRLLETAGDRARIEKELTAWLTEQLPRVMNPDDTPIAPKLALDARESPIFALQHRIVQRGMDGAVFTDALFDEKGQLELVGRLHQPDEDGKQALEAAVTDLLGKDIACNAQALKAHESARDGQPLAWKDAVRQCQAKLAQDSPRGQRARVDRLYFNYENQQLQLVADGVFLADAPTESPHAALSKAIDEVIVSRGQATVQTAAVKRLKNPLTDLQNLTTQRTDLDGVLFASVRYGPDGLLHLDGYLGHAEHKTALTTILAQRLEQIPDALRKGSDPKTTPGWSIDGMKLFPAAKGDMKWQDMLGACQAELASAPEALMRRACLGRAYFTYADAKPDDKDARPRLLSLHCTATFLSKPQDGIEEAALKQKLEQKLTGVSKRLFAGVALDSLQADLTALETPIFDLQKLALAKSYDGILFKEAYYDRDGKLTFDGIRGNAEQLKQARELIESLLADKKKGLAPAGLAPLDSLRLIPWQPMLDDVRSRFAQEKASLYKQTRIDRAYFQYDKTGTNASLHFKGICIYQGKVLTPDEQTRSIADKLKKQLQAKGIEELDIDVGDIARAANPIREMQKKANDNNWDGALFEIGFDAKGSCYVKLAFPLKGQEENLRKMLEDASKNYPHLGPIRQQLRNGVPNSAAEGRSRGSVADRAKEP